jgi:hypothetical protein
MGQRRIRREIALEQHHQVTERRIKKPTRARFALRPLPLWNAGILPASNAGEPPALHIGIGGFGETALPNKKRT